MKKIFTLGLLFIMTNCLYGQNISDTIEVRKALNVIFLQNGKKLTPRRLLEIASSNSESHKEMKIAKHNYDIGSAFGFSGSFLIGWSLGAAFSGTKPNWTTTAIGAGLTAISIPFSRAYSKHAKKAVAIYNNGLNQTGRNAIQIKIGTTGNGIGLSANF